MSDSDFMMEEDYSFEEEESIEENVTLENTYYSAKNLKLENTAEALNLFLQVLEKEDVKGNSSSNKIGDWGFKALKQTIKLNYKLNQLQECLKYYDQLLEYSKIVSRNYAEKSLNNLMEMVQGSTDFEFLQNFYTKTLLKSSNERLIQKCNLKLAKVYLENKDIKNLKKLLQQLKENVRAEDGTTLLEIYALEIQMHTEMKNTKKLEMVYNQCLGVKSGIPHPRIMGIIRECGGKMYMAQKEWSLAQTDFFEAFKNYDEAGSYQRIATLKYLVLANMLMESDINPFDSQETKPFQNDKGKKLAQTTYFSRTFCTNP
jgi:COP9 signalosome complex subunit 2